MQLMVPWYHGTRAQMQAWKTLCRLVPRKLRAACGWRDVQGADARAHGVRHRERQLAPRRQEVCEGVGNPVQHSAESCLPDVLLEAAASSAVATGDPIPTLTPATAAGSAGEAESETEEGV